MQLILVRILSSYDLLDSIFNATKTSPMNSNGRENTILAQEQTLYDYKQSRNSVFFVYVCVYKSKVYGFGKAQEFHY